MAEIGGTDISKMRVPYKSKEEAFTEKDLVSKEPIGQFQEWFNLARQTEGILEPNAMCLATSTKDGIPSARYVLLKGFGPSGFMFYTNYLSQKGRELDSNPKAALVFYWEPLLRSVRVCGTVSKMSEEASDKYFNSRPRGSQIGACVSNQSTPVPNRDVLTDKEQHLKQKFPEGTNIPRPTNWGGYIVVPDLVEFWQGQSDRIHDRLRFRHLRPGEVVDNVLLYEGENGWVYERLSP